MILGQCRVRQNTSRVLSMGTALAGGMFALICPALAQDTTWQSTISSDWSDAAGWSNGVPTAADNVFISGSVPGFPILDPVISGFAAEAASVTLGITGGTASGGLSITSGGSLTSTGGYIGNSAGTDYSVTVDASSTWTNSTDLQIGVLGIGALTINSGSTVSNTSGMIGVSAGSSGSVLLQNGSAWTNSGWLIVGNEGAASLTVASNSLVESATGRIGSLQGSSGSVTVTGDNSAWNNADTLYVGEGGQGMLFINDGGDVTSNSSDVGTYGTGVGSVSVDGVGSTWTNVQNLYLGGSGQGSLSITGGGVVTNVDAVLGYADGAMGEASVEGGSAWNNSGTLTIGRSGEGSLEISSGGSVSNTQGFIARNDGAVGNVAVTGNLSSWANSDALHVGYGGAGGLTVSDGGTVTSATGFIGNQSTSVGQVAVDGEASSWQIGDYFAVGVEGQGSLTISNGGMVTNGQADIAYDANSSGSVSVNDGTWTSTDSLGVGVGGVGSLTVTGGLVQNTLGFIGDEEGSKGTVLVDGASSTWTNSGTLYMGYGGEGALTVSNGGSVTSVQSFIGNAATAKGAVTVQGPGSTWQDSGTIMVGKWGEGALSVTGGGAVESSFGYVADSVDSVGSVIVSGAGSTWTNANSVAIGRNGEGRLSITDGGVVSGTVGLIGELSDGSGAVTVSGANSAWQNSVGFYVGYDGAGELTLADGGAVTVNGGSGTVDVAYQSGSFGTLNIGAAAGDAAAGAGMLNASAIAFGDGDGTLVLNHNGTGYALEADISGAGDVGVYSGETVYSGTATHTGGTTIYGGVLIVNGSIGAVSLEGGVLGGAGSVGNLVVGSGSTVAPGNSIDTLNIVSATFDTGSLLQVELNDGGFVAGTNNDLLNASGAVTINGGTVHVMPENGTDDGSTYTPGTYTIVSAGGGVAGTFDGITDDYVFLDFLDSYDAGNVYLTSEQVVPFSAVALTPNQQAIAGPLENLGTGDEVHDALVGLVGDEDGARAAIDSLTGEIHASAGTALLEDSRFPREAANDHLRAALGGANGGQADDQAGERFSLWGRGFGSWGQWDSNGNAATLDRSIGGGLIGGDAPVGDNLRVGLLSGYSRSSLTVDDRASSGSADTFTLGAYGGGKWNAFSLSGGLAHSWHSLDTERAVAFSGFSDRLNASYSIRTLQAWGEAAYSVEAGAARFEPFANLAYVNLDASGFTETGGAAALTGASQSANATFTTLGVRAATNVRLGGKDVRLSGSVGWRHAFGDTPTTQMRFASGSDAFTIAGVPLARDLLVLDAGIDVDIAENTTLGFAYGGVVGADAWDHSARVDLNVRF